MEQLRSGKHYTIVQMAAEAILKLKILPRIMMLMMSVSAWRVVEWFMTLEDPTSQQAALVSVVTGAMTGAFAVWMNHEGKPHDTSSIGSDSKPSRNMARGKSRDEKG